MNDWLRGAYPPLMCQNAGARSDFGLLPARPAPIFPGAGACPQHQLVLPRFIRV